MCLACGPWSRVGGCRPSWLPFELLAPARRAILSGDDSETLYLARIAELEAEVRALTAELATYKALALAGGNARLPKGSTPEVPGLGERQPTHVNADGTQGIWRGVSGRRRTSPPDADEQL